FGKGHGREAATAAGAVAGAFAGDDAELVELACELEVCSEPVGAGLDESETTLSLLQPVNPAANSDSARKITWYFNFMT
ncbi:MAG TPA: hypothetical protein PKD31_22370, partial [Blastocatellia bacterium]|nr:hypothetical protein [Blastocatellia bacterium]